MFGRNHRSGAGGATLAAFMAITLTLVALGSSVGAVSAESHTVGVPTVTVPSGGLGILALQADLSEMPQYGYVQEEYLYGGTAQAFDAVGTYSNNGVWPVTPSTTAPYKTRMIVRRPSDPTKFNGTVVVEWLNVTAGFDTSPDWQYGRIEMMRKGYAWVGVSAQLVGVQGPLLGLKTIDPARYGSLSHPGDIYSYDIYTQAARALRTPVGANPLAGLRIKRLIADGESQSASRMTTYVNAISPLSHAYDAYLIHSRSAGAPSLSLTGQGATLPNPAFIRTDINTPVLVLEAETDVPRYAPARQADSATFRSWEVAGTSHADLYMLGPASAGILGCTLPVNSGPHHYIFHTALRDLRRWMIKPWRLPPTSPRVALDIAGNVARNQDGNAIGGIRTPQLDEPVATLSGFGNSPGLCGLFGTTVPFTRSQLISRYGNVDQYRLQFLLSEARALDSKFILGDDAFTVLMEAATFNFPA